jgi:hypothetical protein
MPLQSLAQNYVDVKQLSDYIRTQKNEENLTAQVRLLLKSISLRLALVMGFLSV